MVVLIVLFLALAAIAAFGVGPALSVSGSSGPVDVTVSPTSGVTDGQTVHIHAAATTGDLFEIRAHICDGSAAIKNTFNFSFDGAYCSSSPVSAASDAETLVAIPAGTGGKGDLDFRVGEGTGQPWTDYWGNTHALTCDADHACSLVVQLQVTDNTVFYTAPLCYGGGCPPEAGDTPAPPPAPASDDTTPTTTAPASSAPAPSSTIPVVANGAGKSGGSDDGSGAAASSGSGSQGEQSIDGAVADLATSVFGSPESQRAVRVFAAAAAGAIGAVLIVLIVLRARKQMLRSAV